jgi:hypothetical protein
MPDRETYLALIRFHLRLGYDYLAAVRKAKWCLDDSPAPGWTHKEQTQ